jgi:hypothetical protein
MPNLESTLRRLSRDATGYQHMDSAHLDRYLAEFDFRMNTRVKL